MSNVSITDNHDEILRALKNSMERALEAVGLQAEGYAKLNLEQPKMHGSPNMQGQYEYPNVDTGRLVNSITHTNDETVAYIGTNVEYAPYVEMGTSRSRAYPYLKPAVQDHKAEYQAIFDKFMHDA